MAGLPWKVTGRMVPGWTPLTPARPSRGSATDTAVIGSGAPPNALENRSRNCWPPTETCTVWRSVVSASTRPTWVNGGGGMLPGSVSCGMDTQVCTQRPPGPDPAPSAALASGVSGVLGVLVARPGSIAGTASTAAAARARTVNDDVLLMGRTPSVVLRDLELARTSGLGGQARRHDHHA